MPDRRRLREIGAPTAPLMTTHDRKDGVELSLFSTVTTFGTPHDVTLEELRIECGFPADEATAEVFRGANRRASGGYGNATLWRFPRRMNEPPR